ncbi:hypothetical protein [Sphingobacterium sp. MYb382]|uniref:hypothetical protein n=1 Tax=Sphingobacterium sp. MYb382 TaxID=2745278 RepID=UPI0030A8D96F
MSTTGKILIAASMVLCFTWLSQFNKINEHQTIEAGRLYLYSAFPLFLTGLLVYFKGKANLSKKSSL